ncbi:MAG: ATP-binding cassette domain-containing protein [Planctomycetota bacterium]
MLSLEGISVHLGGKQILHRLELAVSAGETLALLGPSGCGKSTLLRAAVGLAPLTSGEISVGLRDGSELSVGRDGARAVREHVGFVVQDGGLFPHMTAMTNLTLAGRERGRDADWCAARARELASMTRLPQELLARFPGELSGGQRQRVALARGLMLDPGLVLLDEPLGALDPVTRRELQVELRTLFTELGKTVVVVTHDYDEAAYLGDRIALMREGRIEQVGTADDLTDRPATAFVERFVSAERPVSRGSS